MKKIYFFSLVFACFVVGCSQSAGEFVEAPAPSSAAPISVGRTDLIQETIALQFERGSLSYRVSERDARVMTRVLEDESEVYEMRIVTSGPDTLMYVVEYPDGGWKLLSGDKRTQPVLAYSQSGNFSLDNGNPGEKIWFAQVVAGLSALRSQKSAPATATAFAQAVDPMWVDLAPATAGYDREADGQWVLESTRAQTSVSQVGPLTKTLWGQGHPWNQCCPTKTSYTSVRSPAGCVAVSGAQMLYYLHFKWGVPATMYESGTCTGDLSSYFFSFSNPTAVAWNKMALSEDDYYHYPDARDRFKSTSVLLGFVGKSVNMQYGIDDSSAYTSDLKSFFNTLEIQSTYGGYNANTVLLKLDERIPVIVRANGTYKNDKYSDGHSWIIDGYQKKFRYTVLTYRWYSRYAIDEQPGEIDDDLLDTEIGTDPDGGGSGDGGPDEPNDNESTLPGIGKITRNEYQDETYTADELSIVSILRDGGDAPDPKDPLYPTNQTREVVTSSVPDGLFWHMNWGWDGLGYETWYVFDGNWAELSYTFKWGREMLVVTGYNK